MSATFRLMEDFRGFGGVPGYHLRISWCRIQNFGQIYLIYVWNLDIFIAIEFTFNITSKYVNFESPIIFICFKRVYIYIYYWS